MGLIQRLWLKESNIALLGTAALKVYNGGKMHLSQYWFECWAAIKKKGQEPSFYIVNNRDFITLFSSSVPGHFRKLECPPSSFCHFLLLH